MSVASISITPTGGTGPYTYFWQPGGQTTQNITGLVAGTNYNVFIEDLFDGEAFQSANINVIDPNTSVGFTSVNVSCYGLSNGKVTAFAGGGTSPYSFYWSTGVTATAASSNALNSIPAGTYNVTVVDANSCPPAIGSRTVSQPTLLLPNGSSTNISCNGANDG